METMNGISIIVPIKSPEPYYPSLQKSIDEVFVNLEHEILEQYERGLVNAVVHGVTRSRYNFIGVLERNEDLIGELSEEG